MNTDLTRRDFLGTVALGTAATTSGWRTAAAAEAAPRTDWFRRHPRVLLDSQIPDPADQGVPGMPARFFARLDPQTMSGPPSFGAIPAPEFSKGKRSFFPRSVRSPGPAPG